MQRNKSEKFKELANKRVNKAIKDLRLISNLANTRNYAYTEEQARQIVKVLQREVEGVKLSFSHETKNSDPDFYLK